MRAAYLLLISAIIGLASGVRLKSLALPICLQENNLYRDRESLLMDVRIGDVFCFRYENKPSERLSWHLFDYTDDSIEFITWTDKTLPNQNVVMVLYFRAIKNVGSPQITFTSTLRFILKNFVATIRIK